MCTLHKPTSPRTPSERIVSGRMIFKDHRVEGGTYPYLLTGVLITLAMLLKVGILLAFCYLHASMEEAPHEHYEHTALQVEYQRKTLC